MASPCYGQQNLATPGGNLPKQAWESHVAASVSEKGSGTKPPERNGPARATKGRAGRWTGVQPFRQREENTGEPWNCTTHVDMWDSDNQTKELQRSMTRTWQGPNRSQETELSEVGCWDNRSWASSTREEWR